MATPDTPRDSTPPVPATPCAACGAPLSEGLLGGACPRCLLANALEGEATGNTLLPPSASRLPARFGEYELLERIARGGMGVVFKARHVRLQRVVALKMIVDGAMASELDVHRFHAETEAAARLEHPNIVPIYEVGEHEGHPYFTMRLMEGGSLADHAQRLRGEPRQAARLMAAVARAVHHGHQHGILHRDLKPPNILLDAEGRPHVGDFGVAKHIEKDGPTRTGTVLGTPAYMAPEQAAGTARALTVSADVYSLGAILYELLSGRPPFVGDTPAHVLQQVLESEPAPLRTLAPGVDRDLETLCHKCLEKQPARRYASAAQLAEDVQRYLEGKPVRAQKDSFAYRASKFVRRNTAGVAAAAVVLLTLIAGVTATLWQARRTAEQARVAAEQRVARQREALGTLKAALARFGTVKETAQGLVLVLPDALWAGARAAELTPKAVATTIDPLAALLANNPELRVRIEAFVDARGDATELQRLSQDRAEALAGRLVSSGVDGARIQASGMGGSSPVAANTTPAGRQRNRRIEVTLVPSGSADTSSASN